jgi:hypothetical protein
MAFSKLDLWRLALAAALLPLNVSAQTLTDCAKLDSDAERLACYDRVVGRVPAPVSPVAAPAPAPVQPSAPAAAMDTMPAPTPKTAVIASPVPVESAPRSAPAANDTIGFPAPSAPKPPPTGIESRIAGHFEGWEGRTRFTLENGQVWENAGGGTLYLVAESPRVRIVPGSFGSWVLSVEGSSARTTVRRVR